MQGHKKATSDEDSHNSHTEDRERERKEDYHIWIILLTPENMHEWDLLAVIHKLNCFEVSSVGKYC